MTLIYRQFCSLRSHVTDGFYNKIGKMQNRKLLDILRVKWVFMQPWSLIGLYAAARFRSVIDPSTLIRVVSHQIECRYRLDVCTSRTSIPIGLTRWSSNIFPDLAIKFNYYICTTTTCAHCSESPILPKKNHLDIWCVYGSKIGFRVGWF